jgi:hypothetical protein
MASSAIQVLPEPVGAVTRQSDRRIAANALSWKGSGLKGSLGGVPILANTFFSRGSALGFILGISLLWEPARRLCATLRGCIFQVALFKSLLDGLLPKPKSLFAWSKTFVDKSKACSRRFENSPFGLKQFKSLIFRFAKIDDLAKSHQMDGTVIRLRRTRCKAR